MPSIAFVTDLHATDRRIDRNSPLRIASLREKISRVRPKIHGLFIGGDTLTLQGKEHWSPLTRGIASSRHREEREAFSAELTDELLPEIIKAADGLPIFMGKGNADALSIDYILKNKDRFPEVRVIDNSKEEFLGFAVAGLGGIEPDNEDSLNILKHSWYTGVLSQEEISKKLSHLSLSLTRWDKAIFMSHMPAFGFVDTFEGRSQGSAAIRRFIRYTRPLLHLCGHVHDAPVADGRYVFGMTHTFIDDRTLSVNTGGGSNGIHDTEAGVRMAVIDLDKISSKQPGFIEQL